MHFHPGQYQAWNSERRFVLVLAGTQGGKTVFGPCWLWREIARRGPGDYMVVTPTYKLLDKKALPSFKYLFEDTLQLGSYSGNPSYKFVFNDLGSRRTFAGWNGEPTNVYFGHAQDPDSLESATAKAVWLDEAGQKKFRLGSWEAIQRRLSIHQGRALITTTPYDLGWLKQKLFDPWHASGRKHADIDVIQFDSTQNPAFPRAEFERARRELPAWKFDLFYRAVFARPAGLIYDAFDPDLHTCKPFTVPPGWPRYMGIDFGGVHTAALFYAGELGGDGKPTGRLFLYREYMAGGRSAKEHAEHLLRGEPMRPFAVGGSKSEDQWRTEFRMAGLSIREPDQPLVEVGIDRVYGAHKAGHIIAFDTMSGYLDQKASYSRALDDSGNPTEVIEDKETFHFMDAERYIVGWLRRSVGSHFR